MKSKLIYREKNQFEDGSVLELVLWELPVKTKDRPHGYKYRMYFGDHEGHSLVRYDNESGKGDHKHIGDKEFPYQFFDKDTLFKDFYRDILRCREIRGNKQ